MVSFIGYAPQENPEVVVYVVIDEVNDYDQGQSSLAVQLAADIMKEIFPYLGITPVPGYDPQTIGTVQQDDDDVVGYSDDYEDDDDYDEDDYEDSDYED